MTSRLNPYISFSDNARQALEFYNDVFGGTLSVNTFGEMGMPEAPEADKIMHGMLETVRGVRHVRRPVRHLLDGQHHPKSVLRTQAAYVSEMAARVANSLTKA